jgi:carboxyl-terminal processing protease
MKKGRALALTFGLFVLGSGAVLGFGAAAEDNADTYRQLKLFGDVFERVRADYVEEVSDEELIESAIRGMLAELDPHSSYMNADEYQEMQEQTRGEFGGLGIQVTMEDGYVKVVSPIDETPASRAGIKSGDLISHIDGESVLGLTLDQAVDLLRGAVDSEVTITVVREGQDPFDVTLVRDIIKVESVRWRTEGEVGYIRITQFNEQTTTGLEEAIADIESKLGPKLIGYVLDLRNNPGGLLSEAISVSDAFLEQGEIVSTRGRHEEDMQRYNARPGDLAKGLPLVVLINDGSASASEIVAGALKDHQRAILMGTRSFGKGSVQTIVPLPGHGAMRLTTSRYYTPSGVSIQATGIEPDIEVALATIEVIESPERHEEDLRGILTNPNAPKDEDGAQPEDTTAPEGATEPESSTEPAEPAQPEAGTPPASEEDKAADAKPGEEKPAEEATGAVGPENDYQLQRALDLLRGYALFSQRTQTE